MKRNVQREFRFDASESETLCMDRSSLCGNRETSVVPCGEHSSMGRLVKATSRAANMYVTEESDDLVVPAKRANKAGTPVAESVEERGSTKGNRLLLSLIPDTVPETVRAWRMRVRQVGRLDD